MGLRIRTNVSSLISQRSLGDNKSKMDQSLERLATGYRINRSSDDAAGLAVSEGIRAKVRGLNVAKRNANDGISMVQIAEGAMNEMSNIVVRLRELAVQAASDTVGSTERGYLNKEYNQLVEEVDRIAQTTEFNSNKLFSEDGQSEFVIQVGVNGSSADANQDTIKIDMEGLRFSSEELELGSGDVIGAMDGGDGPSREEIAGRLDKLDSALTRFANERATLGSVQSRLGSAINNISISTENMEAARSRIKDADIAAESSAMAKNRVMMQASTSVLTQANQSSDIALQLLR